MYPTEHFDSTKYKSSHKNPSIKVRDRKNVEELYHWMLKIEDRIKERTKNTENTSLCDIKLETYFNCICQVVGIYYFQEESNHCLLKVTDGTKINFNSLRQTGSIEGKQKVGLLDLSKEFIYDISLFDDHVDDVKDIKEKDYVKIVNVHAKSVTDELAIKAKKTLNLEEVIFFIFFLFMSHQCEKYPLKYFLRKIKSRRIYFFVFALQQENYGTSFHA